MMACTLCSNIKSTNVNGYIILEEPMTAFLTVANKRLVRRFIDEVINPGNLDALGVFVPRQGHHRFAKLPYPQ
jgi:hypothetical protein